MSLEMRIRSMDEMEDTLIQKYGFTRSTENQTTLYNVPEELGSGYITFYTPCEGTTLSITKMKLKRPIVVNYEEYDSEFEVSHCIAGSIVYSETGVIDTKLKQNDYGVYTKPDGRGMMMYPSDEEIFAVSLLASGHFFANLPCSEQMADRKNGDSTKLANSLMKPKRINASLSNLFDQLHSGQVTDDLYPLHIEGVTKLVLAKLWQDNIIEPLKGTSYFRCAATEMKAIRKARDILHGRLLDPPTIPELAKLVMLNEYKLKNGFRELYGKTIFSYIRELRMKNAKDMLENRDLSISQIAGQVGYINTSHFARAFRKEFGMNPSDLRFGV